jgi:hypothetical protein
MEQQTLGEHLTGRTLAIGVLGAAALAATLVVVLDLSSGAGASHAGGMDAMSFDLDVSANTATSLGPLDDCIEANPGDNLTLDVTAEAIPVSNPMIAFSYNLNFVATYFAVESADAGFLLAEAAGSNVLDVSDPVPDSDGTWTGAAADTSPTATTSDTGSGVLQRLTMSIDSATPAGVYDMSLTFAAHIDPVNSALVPDLLRPARVAVGTSCQTPAPVTVTPITPGPSTIESTSSCLCAPPTPTPGILPDAGGHPAPLLSEPVNESRNWYGFPIGIVVVMGVLGAGAGFAACWYLWHSQRRRN